MRFMKFILFFFSLVLYTQCEAQFSASLGLGQQLGCPGVRIGYEIKDIEPSINFGIIPFGQNYGSFPPYNLGFGATYFSNYNSMDFKVTWSYNFGLIIGKNYLLNNEIWYKIHSLTRNIEGRNFSVLKGNLKFGYGICYSNDFETKILPIFTLAYKYTFK